MLPHIALRPYDLLYSCSLIILPRYNAPTPFLTVHTFGWAPKADLVPLLDKIGFHTPSTATTDHMSVSQELYFVLSRMELGLLISLHALCHHIIINAKTKAT